MRIRCTQPNDRDALAAMFRSAEEDYGREALSEHKRLRVLGERVIDLVAHEGGDLIGYAQAAWHGGGREAHWAIEVVVSPSATSDTWVTMLERVVAIIPSTRIRYLWVTRETELPIAQNNGWRVDRSIHEMHIDLQLDMTPSLPDGVAIRPFRRGEDEERWLEVHNISFAGHPEVGGMTRRELDLRLEQSWFDPDGLLLAWRGGEVIGSCWTKLQSEAVGEIYLIGLRPEAQGIGLGTALVTAGLADLGRRQGARDGMLYVDGANRTAFALYEKMGFKPVSAVYRLTDTV